MTGNLPGTSSQSVLLNAAQWGQAVLLGPLATSVAVLAVAGVGLMMLTGRMDVRRAAQVVLGCFILFGAPIIAAGLRGIVEQAAPQPPAATTAPPPLNGTYKVPVNDPYAGASVPRQ